MRRTKKYLEYENAFYEVIAEDSINDPGERVSGKEALLAIFNEDSPPLADEELEELDRWKSEMGIKAHMKIAGIEYKDFKLSLEEYRNNFAILPTIPKCFFRSLPSLDKS